ncbi:RNA-binding domain-containing protein [Paenibacillus sp. UASWS1643]|uniref:RNA-binding domain-containing protein n=1 Tax=Paenibacillus sp. UASWS1643 TaxID=2580422 RepID=UPI00123967E0|nr:RNA-binding domain-containing protein [Paenibacillus sp. UASWS1643]KAA8747228.1 TIR domain-containing protein [Paenibacillus sp. UASWS1643]
MNIVEIIQNKINEKDRTNIVYIHPVIPNEEIAQYISAFSNENGGIVVFGVKDDGRNLRMKKSAFRINEKEKIIREMIDSHVKLCFGEFYEGEVNKLEYIYIEKNEETVCFNGIPFRINIVNNRPQPINRKKLFLSYCQKDSCIADIVEEKIKGKIRSVDISRDIRDVKYKESFSEFMQSIGNHDIVISVVSDQYLKSRNCMYEVVETMRDRNFIDKLFHIVISKDDVIFYDDSTQSQIAADIYSMGGLTGYLKHWQSVEDELRQLITELGDPLLISNHADELKVITKIKMEIQDFLKILRDRKGISFGDMFRSDFVDIVSRIQN